MYKPPCTQVSSTLVLQIDGRIAAQKLQDGVQGSEKTSSAGLELQPMLVATIPGQQASSLVRDQHG